MIIVLTIVLAVLVAVGLLIFLKGGDWLALFMKKNQATERNGVAPDLYRFMKTMDFYKKVIPGTPIILKPSGGILDYLKGVQQ